MHFSSERILRLEVLPQIICMKLRNCVSLSGKHVIVLIMTASQNNYSGFCLIACHCSTERTSDFSPLSEY